MNRAIYVGEVVSLVLVTALSCDFHQQSIGDALIGSMRCQYSAELSHGIDGKRLVACVRKEGITFHLCSSGFGSTQELAR